MAVPEKNMILGSLAPCIKTNKIPSNTIALKISDADISNDEKEGKTLKT
jgi:hypothetical protein